MKKNKILVKIMYLLFAFVLVSSSYLPVGATTISAAPAPSFTSWFGTQAPGWWIASGPWNITQQGWCQSTGVTGVTSSIVHKDLYPTLTYEVKLKRTANSSNGNFLIIRGTEEPLGELNTWRSGYYFQYTNNGSFNVFKVVNGKTTTLKNWTYYSGIKPYAWNRLMVTAQGSSLKFYINGGLVWSGSDKSLTTGKVGIGMYRDQGGWNPLSADWAKVTTSVSAAAFDEPMALGIGEPVTSWDNLFVAPDAQP